MARAIFWPTAGSSGSQMKRKRPTCGEPSDSGGSKSGSLRSHSGKVASRRKQKVDSNFRQYSKLLTLAAKEPGSGSQQPQVTSSPGLDSSAVGGAGSLSPTGKATDALPPALIKPSSSHARHLAASGGAGSEHSGSNAGQATSIQQAKSFSPGPASGTGTGAGVGTGTGTGTGVGTGTGAGTGVTPPGTGSGATALVPVPGEPTLALATADARKVEPLCGAVSLPTSRQTFYELFNRLLQTSSATAAKAQLKLGGICEPSAEDASGSSCASASPARNAHLEPAGSGFGIGLGHSLRPGSGSPAGATPTPTLLQVSEKSGASETKRRKSSSTGVALWQTLSSYALSRASRASIGSNQSQDGSKQSGGSRRDSGSALARTARAELAAQQHRQHQQLQQASSRRNTQTLGEGLQLGTDQYLSVDMLRKLSLISSHSQASAVGNLELGAGEAADDGSATRRSSSAAPGATRAGSVAGSETGAELGTLESLAARVSQQQLRNGLADSPSIITDHQPTPGPAGQPETGPKRASTATPLGRHGAKRIWYRGVVKRILFHSSKRSLKSLVTAMELQRRADQLGAEEESPHEGHLESHAPAPGAGSSQVESGGRRQVEVNNEPLVDRGEGGNLEQAVESGDNHQQASHNGATEPGRKGHSSSPLPVPVPVPVPIPIPVHVPVPAPAPAPVHVHGPTLAHWPEFSVTNPGAEDNKCAREESLSVANLSKLGNGGSGTAPSIRIIASGSSLSLISEPGKVSPSSSWALMGTHEAATKSASREAPSMKQVGGSPGPANAPSPSGGLEGGGQEGDFEFGPQKGSAARGRGRDANSDGSQWPEQLAPPITGLSSGLNSAAAGSPSSSSSAAISSGRQASPGEYSAGLAASPGDRPASGGAGRQSELAENVAAPMEMELSESATLSASASSLSDSVSLTFDSLASGAGGGSKSGLEKLPPLDRCRCALGKLVEGDEHQVGKLDPGQASQCSPSPSTASRLQQPQVLAGPGMRKLSADDCLIINRQRRKSLAAASAAEGAGQSGGVGVAGSGSPAGRADDWLLVAAAAAAGEQRSRSALDCERGGKGANGHLSDTALDDEEQLSNASNDARRQSVKASIEAAIHHLLVPRAKGSRSASITLGVTPNEHKSLSQLGNSIMGAVNVHKSWRDWRQLLGKKKGSTPAGGQAGGGGQAGEQRNCTSNGDPASSAVAGGARGSQGGATNGQQQPQQQQQQTVATFLSSHWAFSRLTTDQQREAAINFDQLMRINQLTLSAANVVMLAAGPTPLTATGKTAAVKAAAAAAAAANTPTLSCMGVAPAVASDMLRGIEPPGSAHSESEEAARRAPTGKKSSAKQAARQANAISTGPLMMRLQSGGNLLLKRSSTRRSTRVEHDGQGGGGPAFGGQMEQPSSGSLEPGQQRTCLNEPPAAYPNGPASEAGVGGPRDLAGHLQMAASSGLEMGERMKQAEKQVVQQERTHTFSGEAMRAIIDHEGVAAHACGSTLSPGDSSVSAEIAAAAASALERQKRRGEQLSLILEPRFDKKQAGAQYPLFASHDLNPILKDLAQLVRKHWKCNYIECSAASNWNINPIISELTRTLECNNLLRAQRASLSTSDYDDFYSDYDDDDEHDDDEYYSDEFSTYDQFGSSNSMSVRSNSSSSSSGSRGGGGRSEMDDDFQEAGENDQDGDNGEDNNENDAVHLAAKEKKLDDSRKIGKDSTSPEMESTRLTDSMELKPVSQEQQQPTSNQSQASGWNLHPADTPTPILGGRVPGKSARGFMARVFEARRRLATSSASSPGQMMSKSLDRGLEPAGAQQSCLRPALTVTASGPTTAAGSGQTSRAPVVTKRHKVRLQHEATIRRRSTVALDGGLAASAKRRRASAGFHAARGHSTSAATTASGGPMACTIM